MCALPISIREDRHVSVFCREHHAINPGELWFERMDDVPFRFDGGLDLAAELDEARDERRLDRQFEAVRWNNGVKRASIRNSNLGPPPTDRHRQPVEEHKAR